MESISCVPEFNLEQRQIVKDRGRVWVIGAKGFLVNVERALIERFGFGVITHGIIQDRQIVKGLSDIWVIGFEGFLSDLKRALIERLGFSVITHGIIQRRQIV